jgi:hypothetical protein
MREIDDAHDAEYQRQSRCDQEQEHGRGEAAHELAEQKRACHRRSDLRFSNRAYVRIARDGSSRALINS